MKELDKIDKQLKVIKVLGYILGVILLICALTLLGLKTCIGVFLCFQALDIFKTLGAYK